jgi:Tol biopolymer transport system component
MKSLWIAPFLLTILTLITQLQVPAADEPKGPTPINLVINTDADEDDPHISSDGKTLFYASNAQKNWDIWVSTRALTTQPWRKGVLFDDYLQSKDDERSVFVTPEGRYPQYMFACAKKTRDVTRPNFDIFVSVKQNARASFTAPTPLNTIDTAADELHPWLTPDGRRLYFSRRDRDGWRVYTSTRQATTGAAGFMEPAAIKELPADFHHATLTPDGKTMYLQGPLEKDRWGLFVSTYTGGQWSEPAPLNVNSPDAPDGDMSPCLSRDGKMLYFSSDRPGGKGKKDIWVVPVEQLKKVAKEK